MFYIDDAGDANDCPTCEHIHQKQLDPDIVPVKWSAPTHNYGAKLVRHGGVTRVEKTELPRELETEEVVNGYQPSTASLSDPDSDTEDWKLDPAARAEKKHRLEKRHHAYVEEGEEKEEVDFSRPARSNPFEDSPNTIKHRDLVQEQLNQLPSLFAQSHQPMMPRQYGEPIPPAQSGFYNGPMGHWQYPGRTMPIPAVEGPAPRPLSPPSPPPLAEGRWRPRKH
jgi:hypothetical protein